MANPNLALEIEHFVSESGENETFRDRYHGILLTVELQPRAYWLVTTTFAQAGEFVGHKQIEYSLS